MDIYEEACYQEDKPDLKSMTLTELTEWIKSVGEPAFRGKQLYQWMHQKLVESLDEMTNLPSVLKEKIRDSAQLTVLKQVQVQISKVDGTRKYLFALPDGNLIESVLMKYKHGNSVCISSQAGCRMGCRFCASTIDGLARSLTPAEMLEQIYRIQRDLGERISNIVVMGSGEPLDNYTNLIRFIVLISAPEGLNISERNLTISTCGLVPQIYRFADAGVHCTLALSLHAPNDQVRKTLMPIANRYSLKEVLPACDYFFEKTGRRVTFEYSLVAGVNDNKEEAMALAALIGGRNCHVNLIPVNPVKERSYRPTDRANVMAFQNLLEKSGINVTIRREMGRDINGACGQLRRSYMEDSKKEK